MNRRYLRVKLKRLFLLKNIYSKEVVLFDSSIATKNKGDQIIMSYCEKPVTEIFADKKMKRIAFHKAPDNSETKKLACYKYKFICGTNVLTPTVEWFSPFKTSEKVEQYNDICLLGAGWGRYAEKTSETSVDFYHCILSHHWIHSVRDRYTERKCREMGFENVLFTACPTMWNLLPELCREIPKNKTKEVIFTITDYDRDQKNDREMIKILRENYEKLYFWAQGTEDRGYLSDLVEDTEDITIIDDLDSYTGLLKKQQLDYVGTRLHAGIHALNYKKRSIIIAIDNRATEMGKDTNLPIIMRDEVAEKLENMINSDFETKIVLPLENIEKWKEQFR